MWIAEYTDTFGGEANYSWVHRWTLDPAMYIKLAELQKEEPHEKVKRWLVKRAKALSGLTGHRCETNDMGDVIEIRPRGMCTILSITWRD